MSSIRQLLRSNDTSSLIPRPTATQRFSPRAAEAQVDLPRRVPKMPGHMCVNKSPHALTVRGTASYDAHESDQPLPTIIALPREIRDMIYEYLLVQETAIYTNRVSQIVCRTATPVVTNWLALSLTNKQLHDEAHGIFFGMNTFKFHINEPFRRIPDRSLELVRRCDVYLWRDVGKTCLEMSFKPTGFEAAFLREPLSTRLVNASQEHRAERKLLVPDFCVAGNTGERLNMAVLSAMALVLKRRLRTLGASTWAP
jgi:hypothetical protein